MANRQNKRAIQNLRGHARMRVDNEDYKRHLANGETNTQKGRKQRRARIMPTSANSKTPYNITDSNVTRVYIEDGGHDSYIPEYTEILESKAEEWKSYDEEKKNRMASIITDALPFLNSPTNLAVADGSNGATVSLDVVAGSYAGFRGDPSHGVHNNLRIMGTEAGASFVPLAGVGDGGNRTTGSEAFNKNKKTTSVPAAPRPAPEEIEQKAKNYDESTDLPNKPQHASKFASEMHPDFVPYAKAVLFDLWDQLKASVELNSTLRTVAKQKEMYEFVRSWRAANPKSSLPEGAKWLPPGYGGAPAKPGHSKHNLGVAIDFNPTIASKTYSSRDSKSTWESSGIPNIIKSNGLRWGGDFSTNYDPIHMDLPIDESVRSAIVAATENITDPKQVIVVLGSIPIDKGSDSTDSDNTVPI